MVVDREKRTTGNEIAGVPTKVVPFQIKCARTAKSKLGSVADVVDAQPKPFENVVVPLTSNIIRPVTSQSPAVREIEVIFAATPVVSATSLADGITLSMYSPKLPVLALLLVVVPTMPAVWDGVIAPVVLSVVNAPVFGAVPPMAGGLAR